jgi:hypothetical protein
MDDLNEIPPEGPEVSETATMPPSPVEQGVPIRAILAGAAAAVLGGAIWAFIAVAADLEVGWIAWGIGLLVGFAMTRVTDKRGTTMAGIAAALSAVGLIAGKLFIVQALASGQWVEEIESTPELMTQAAAYELRTTDGWSDSVLAELDLMSETDTLSDQLWETMIVEATAHAEATSPEQRMQMAQAFAEAVIGEVGLVERVQSQLSLFDLLWFGLALTTAWRMLVGREKKAA